RTSTTYNYDGDLPRAPYTPKISEISLSYSTVLAAPSSFFHLHPFGHTAEAITSERLFPETANEGELYIGVEHLDPPQRLSMLFQAVDGSANPLKSENTIKWYYLKGDEWVELEQQEVDDKTHNLTGSGIVGIAVPEGADIAHSILPTGMHWFRLSVESDTDALNNLLSIDAQATTATFLDQGNDPDFVLTPLAGGTISKLVASDAAVKKITQPYESFGGRAQEDDDGFYVRVSERLRHKDRAVTMWDYEHLVLQEFPSIYKVKCLNHTQLVRDNENEIVADNELKPGHVVVVPIRYVSSNGAVNPLRPYTDTKTLGEIDRFLRERISPFVVLEVANPRIEEVQVKFKVAFNDDIADISFYKDELKNAIIGYLTPWSSDEGAEISFGGKWHKSAIIDFVEEQPYVHYLKDFEMYHKKDIAQSDGLWNRVDEEVAQATTARSILVSHAMHTIEEIV
ncbi:MAG TPA: baseplate J/gp47 family protein, partial [Rhodothermia bacterium]